jgi:phosphoribosylaminoimidazole-succinocarboxamide synthase
MKIPVKGAALYAGKAKTVYQTDDPDVFIMEYRDDVSAFDGEKISQLSRKGLVNNQFNAFIMQKLQAAGIETHHLAVIAPHVSLVKRLQMLPLECVVRNFAAGSLTKRLGIPIGQTLWPPTFEFFLKNDALKDPMVNESHIETFQWATAAQVSRMKQLTFLVNACLQPLFEQAGMLLVDYKLEFGLIGERLVLGDEFTPDGCRIWDKTTREKLDKDRFRQDLGDVIESYEIVGRRLGMQFNG